MDRKELHSKIVHIIRNYYEQETKAANKILDLFNNSNEEYEPYFGWCDVDGCENEGCSGGNAWRETGYWKVCYEHSAAYRNGNPQPKMKQKAIDREKRRDKKTGWLSD